MRLVSIVVVGALVATSCGTPVVSEDAFDFEETPSTSTVPEPVVVSSTTAEAEQVGAGFDAEAMDRLFPPSRASIVLWGASRSRGVEITVGVRIDSPSGSILDEVIELAPSDGTLQLLADIDVEPEQAYDVSVTITQNTTDTTDGGQEVAPHPLYHGDHAGSRVRLGDHGRSEQRLLVADRHPVARGWRRSRVTRRSLRKARPRPL